MPNSETEFTITEDHLKLLRRTFFEWNDEAYDGAPMVDIKRPYGNSGGVQFDISQILNLKGIETDDGTVYTKEQSEYCRRLHRDMMAVFQIICSTGQISTGTYTREGSDVYSSIGWKRKK